MLTPQPSVAVLLATYNGAVYLREQLNSLRDQTHKNWFLVVSDDGSSDETLAIIKQFGEETGRAVMVRRGPRRGFSANFLSLLTDNSIIANYYACCDQDDIWDAGKLERAVAMLSGSTGPALYCARTRYVTAANEDMGLSPRFTRAPSFANALVQNVGGGNSMVFNAAAHALVVEGGIVDVAAHDWWLYILISGAGGIVVYDPEPCLRYRQHAGNLIGHNHGLQAMVARALRGFGGVFREWNGRNLAALANVRHLITPANRAIWDDFQKARGKSVVPRLFYVNQSGVYRQTTGGNLLLFGATLLGKI